MPENERTVETEQKALLADLEQLITKLDVTEDPRWIAPVSAEDSGAAIGQNGTLSEITATQSASWTSWAMKPLETVLPDVAKSMDVAGVGSWANAIAGPALWGLLRIFGGEESTTPTESVKFALPPSQTYDLGFSSEESGLFGLDRGADSMPRAWSGESAGSRGQVVVQVNALDSQSFLDRRSEIADAVRIALLESHSLQDVIGLSE